MTLSNDPERIAPTLAKVEEIWNKVPQLRLGQLLLNLPFSSDTLYYMDDDVLLKKLEDMY